MKDNQYKNIIDTFVSVRYEYLLECSKNVLKGKACDPGDLLSELVIYLYDNKEKLEPYISLDMLEGFSVSWLKLQSQYNNTTFMRKYKRNRDNDSVDVLGGDVASDDINEGEDEYIKDLRRVYTDEQVDKILKIHEIYPNLSKPQQILFRAYFLEGLSYDKIKDKYTFFENKGGKKVFYKSKVSIFNLMTDLKEEIKRKL